MPTKRTRRAHYSVPQGLTVSSFGVNEVLGFACGWRPPTNEHLRRQARWASWRDYLADYAAIRAELLSDRGSLAYDQGTGDLDCFAERLYQQYGTAGPPPWFVTTFDRIDLDTLQVVPDVYV